MLEQTFDVKATVSKVNSLIGSDPGKIEECRDIFLEQIFDWSDYYNEYYASDPSSEEGKKHLQEMLELWQAYADFEIALRQYKKAAEVFEKAMGDPIVGKTARVYLAYAEYCVGRGRLATAHKALLTGLCAGLTDAKGNERLWSELLTLVRQANKNDSLSLEQLRSLVAEQVADASLLAPLPSAGHAASSSSQSSQSSSSSYSSSSSSSSSEAAATPVATETQALPSSAVSEFTLPALESLASAPAKSDKFSMEVAESKDAVGSLEELESIAGMTPEQLVRSYRLRPAMLFSATHKEPMVLGLSLLDEAERSMLEAYLQAPLHSLHDLGSNGSKAATVLDALEGLWSAQALQERTFDVWIAQLNSLHRQQEAELHSESERRKHSNRSAVQREVLQATINKTLFSLLLEQQRLLCELRFPRFSALFIDSLSLAPKACAAAGPALQSFFDPPVMAEMVQQQRLVCAVLSVRLLDRRTPRLQRGVSVDSDTADSIGEDYYSSEAKKMRKRRRSVQLQSYGQTGPV